LDETLGATSDLEAAEFVPPDNASRTPFFFGNAKSVRMVRVASSPGATDNDGPI